jgi:hypothetical protein
MATYPPPTEITSIFNPNNFTSDENAGFITIITADGRYLKLIGGTLTGILNISDTTQSTNATTGALVSAGGVGVAKDLNVAGNINTTGASSIIQAQSGSASLPPYTFSGDPDTGMYRVGANFLGFSTGGVNRFAIGGGTITGTLPFFAPNGSASSASYNFGTGTAGFYLKGSDNLAWSTNNTERMDLSNTALTTQVRILAPGGSVGAPSLSFSGDSDTGIYSAGANILGFATAGIQRAFMSSGGFQTSTPILGALGSAGVPGHSFGSDSNTGMYSTGSDVLGFSTNGTERLSISTTATTSTLPILNSAGSVSAPSISFSGDTNTGIYNSGADTLDIATNGTNRLSIGTSTITSTLSLITPRIYSGVITMTVTNLATTTINSIIQSVGTYDVYKLTIYGSSNGGSDRHILEGLYFVSVATGAVRTTWVQTATSGTPPSGPTVYASGQVIANYNNGTVAVNFTNNTLGADYTSLFITALKVSA